MPDRLCDLFLMPAFLGESQLHFHHHRQAFKMQLHHKIMRPGPDHADRLLLAHSAGDANERDIQPLLPIKHQRPRPAETRHHI